MKEQLYTIPLNDAINANDECPFCFIERNVEQDLLDFVLGSGSSYMESDVREQTDKAGFCRNHFKKMFDTAYSTLDIKWVSDTYHVLIKNFEDKKRFKQTDHLVSLGYCETFANIIVDKNKYSEAVVYAEEGLSKDMRAYLLMK